MLLFAFFWDTLCVPKISDPSHLTSAVDPDFFYADLSKNAFKCEIDDKRIFNMIP